MLGNDGVSQFAPEQHPDGQFAAVQPVQTPLSAQF
jgi:hypothetical protein